jgi:HrpA-like RNA helicase
MLPTLLLPGKILPQKWMDLQEKRKLSNVKSIDWIIDYIVDRSWNGDTPPKIMPTGGGHRVGVFRSGTGTGKSTVIPPYLFNKFYEERRIKKNIACTQPTIVTTVEIPYQIAMYNKNLIMGETIGYQTSSLQRKPVKGVIFLTPGVLIMHFKTLTDEEIMKKYSFILLDEIHNRSIETDTLLFYIKKFLERNYAHKDCPYIILMSGTFEPGPLMEYFKCPDDSFLDIVGSTFPIEEHFSKYDVIDYLTYVGDLVEKIHIENVDDIYENKTFRDIIVFFQGSSQIKDLVKKIHMLNYFVFSKGLQYAKKHSKDEWAKYEKKGGDELKEKSDKYYICPVILLSENFQKGEDDYRNLFSDMNTIKIPIYEFNEQGLPTKILHYATPSRRVICATNAAETGITIDSLRYVIDTGYVNEGIYNAEFNSGMLLNKNITKANVRQRRGRVGRKYEGIFYATYTKKTFDILLDEPYPDIIKADITPFLLDNIISETNTELIQIDKDDIKEDSFQMNQFDQWWYNLNIEKPFKASELSLMQYPPIYNIKNSLEKLYVLGFIDHEYKPTLFGYIGSKFRKHTIENIRMILAGYHHGANILDLVTIAAFLRIDHKLGIKKNKYKPRDPLRVGDKEAEIIYTKVIADELIEYLFIWDDFIQEVQRITDLIKEKKIIGGKDKKHYTPNENFKNHIKLKDMIEKNKLTHNIQSYAKIGLKSNPTIADQLFSKLNAKPERDSIHDLLEKWANKNRFDYESLLKITTYRDELLYYMLNIELNPYYNGLGLPRGKYNLVNIMRQNFSEGMDEIIKIKKCIYEGYRLNLLIYDEASKSYVSPYYGNKVLLDKNKILNPMLVDKIPKNIITTKNTLMYKTDSYVFTGGDVSVLDGFVDIDIDYINS